MENQTTKSGKAIVHEMLDTIVGRYHDVDNDHIEFSYPSLGDVKMWYDDVDKYDMVYVRYELTMPEMYEDDLSSEAVMMNNICKARFSSCQFAARYCAVFHDVLIPAYSPRRDAIFKREFDRFVEAVQNVRSFMESNVLYQVDQSYSELMSDLLKV